MFDHQRRWVAIRDRYYAWRRRRDIRIEIARATALTGGDMRLARAAFRSYCYGQRAWRWLGTEEIDRFIAHHMGSDSGPGDGDRADT